MTLFKPALLASMSAAVLAMGAPQVEAQSVQGACGAQYRVSPGDTLYRIAQRCRVSLNRIMELNPGIDPRALEVGAVLRMTADAQIRPPAGDGHDRYRVQQGDTMAEIAQRLGLSLFELLAQNEDVDPWNLGVGDEIKVPGAERQPGFSIDPNSGEVGSNVRISARNLRPHDWVTIGAGETAAQWRDIRLAQVEDDGQLRTTVEVPDWADAGDRLVFVIDTDRGLTLKSDDFVVTGDRRPTPPEERHWLSLEGRVEQGVECMILTTPDGDVYSLVSDDARLDAGEYVQIEGHRADTSFCMQGRATVEVERLREVSPW